MDADAWLKPRFEGRRLVLAAEGAWTSVNANFIEHAVEVVIRAKPDADEVDIDIGGLEHLDTYGAWLIERLRRATLALGLDTAIVGVDPRYQVLMDQIAAANQKPVTGSLREQPVVELLVQIGHGVSEFGRDLVAIANMLGGAITALGRVALRPQRFRLASVVHQLDFVGFRAVPIIVLITLVIGAILAQQGIFHFRRFGAETFVVDMVGILTLREVGVLIVSIMVAGRSGSAYTAELGSMKMREEIDALHVMGLDAIEVLILPRLIALIIAVPILTFIGSMSALFGAGLVCWLYGGFAPETFLDRLREVIDLNTFQVGMYKAPFMAAVIGLVAAVEGMQVGGSSESLGERTTSSVVKSIFLVIVLDGLFAIFFAAIGK